MTIDHNEYNTRLEERLKQSTGDCFLMRSIRNEEEAESLAVSQRAENSRARQPMRAGFSPPLGAFRHKISFPETENTG